jgi:uncharacterized Zn finger protein
MGDLIACPFCSENFTSVSLLTSHAVKHHWKEVADEAQEDEDARSTVKCRICGAVYWARRSPAKTINGHLNDEGGLVDHIIRVNIFDEIPLPF